jgi:hypothetical protein
MDTPARARLRSLAIKVSQRQWCRPVCATLVTCFEVSIELALVRTAENPMHIANEVEVISAKVMERFFHGEGAE